MVETLPEVTIEAPRQSGQQIDSVSGEYYLNPKLITRPRMKHQREVYPGANDEEIATLVVGGFIFQDWETVWFQHTLGDPYAQFKFTAAEDEPIPLSAILLQFKPGDEFTLFLGGYPVMKGVILIRQVAYDKNSHVVSLQGVSLTWYAARASIIDQDSEYEGSFEEIAGKVLAPTCSSFKTLGKLDATPFKPAQKPNPGETIFQFLERLARDRNIFVTSDPYGDFVFIGDHAGKSVADLVEGENILKMQCIIADLAPYSEYIIRGEKPASDQSNMGDAAQMEAVEQGTAKCYSPSLTPIEHPVWTKPELELRAQHEYDWHEGQKIEANITVQGWFNSRSGLRWDVAQDVYVKSPMAMLDMLMVIETVTFTQDSKNGSLSVLKCVAPWRWNDNAWIIGSGLPPIQKRTPSAQANSNPATSPPTQTPHSQR